MEPEGDQFLEETISQEVDVQVSRLIAGMHLFSIFQLIYSFPQRDTEVCSSDPMSRCPCASDPFCHRPAELILGNATAGMGVATLKMGWPGSTSPGAFFQWLARLCRSPTQDLIRGAFREQIREVIRGVAWLQRASAPARHQCFGPEYS